MCIWGPTRQFFFKRVVLPPTRAMKMDVRCPCCVTSGSSYWGGQSTLPAPGTWGLAMKGICCFGPWSDSGRMGAEVSVCLRSLACLLDSAAPPPAMRRPCPGCPGRTRMRSHAAECKRKNSLKQSPPAEPQALAVSGVSL